MKLTSFLILVTCLHVSANGIGQNVTLSIKDASLENVFTEIIRQSGTTIIYDDVTLKNAKPVTIKVKDASAEEVLNLCLKGQPFSYSWKDGYIFVKPITTTQDLNPRLQEHQFSDTLPPPITGIIRDADGKPLAGVNIVIKGTKKGTVSSGNGSFSINANEDDILILSSIGYAEKEIKVTSSNQLGLILLSLSDSPLDEVQIIAYGQTSQRLNTGNVSTVKASVIEKQPISNPLYALQGRVPGLDITPTTGLAGGAVKIKIRGQNSLNFQADPLIVIDGLPILNNIPGLGYFNLSEFSSLNFINSNDIESIDVLKDADATSIFGSRGANGAILITTKKGKAGQTKVDLNVRSGTGKVAKKMKLLNTEQYLELRKEAFKNSNIDINTLTLARNNADLTYWDQTRYTDWQEELIGGSSNYNDFQGSVSGGSENIQYLIGGNYHKETTVFPGKNSDIKTSVHINLTGTSHNRKFKTSINAAYLVNRNTLPGIDLTNQALTIAPNAPSLYKGDGTLNYEPFSTGLRSWDNPLRELYKTYDATLTNLVASASLSYMILPSLEVKVQGGYNRLNGNSFRKVVPFEGRPQESMGLLAIAGFNDNVVEHLSVDPQISYKKNLGIGDVTVLIGSAFQYSEKGDQQITASGATSDALLKNLAASTSYILSNTSSEYKYAAAFARINYNIDNKYLINLNGRRDGSSRFGPNKKYGNFGSVGAAWIFSREKIIEDNIPGLSFGKLRVSYGSGGNDGIGDYQYQERYEPIEVGVLYQGARAYRTTGLFNSYFAWEVTRKAELGLELGFFKDRILLTSSFYRNRSDNQLVNYGFPSTAGPGQPLYNLPALIQNAGIEFTLNTINFQTTQFKWVTNVVYSRNRNKLVSYPDIENSPYYKAIVGQPFYGVSNIFKSAGVDPFTGNYQFIKEDGNISFNPENTASPDGGAYLRIMTSPKYSAGILNTFDYKGFSVDVFFQYIRQNARNPLFEFAAPGSSVNNQPIEVLDRWQKTGDNTRFQKVFRTYPDEYNASRGYAFNSDIGYVDASFLRLKNLSISYNVLTGIKKINGISVLRVFLLGQNLLTFTNYKGLDPETQSIGSLPPLKVITAGFQITL